MALVEVLRKTVVEEIGNFQELGGFSAYSLKNPELRSLYGQGIITDDTLNEGIDLFLTRNAREHYRRIIDFKKKNPSSSYVGMSFPEYVAYGISKGIFTKGELDALPDILEDFMRLNNIPNLLEIKKNELLNPKPLPVSEGTECYCCDCMR